MSFHIVRILGLLKSIISSLYMRTRQNNQYLHIIIYFHMTRTCITILKHWKLLALSRFDPPSLGLPAHGFIVIFFNIITRQGSFIILHVFMVGQRHIRESTFQPRALRRVRRLK